MRDEGDEEEGVGSSQFRNSSCSAGLKAQVPSGFFLGSQGGCDRLSPLILDAVPCSSSKEEGGFGQQVRRRSRLPAHPLRGKGGRTSFHAGDRGMRDEGDEEEGVGSSLCRSSPCSAGLKAQGPVGVLPRLQGGCDRLSPLILDAVGCSSSKEEGGFGQQVRRRSRLPAHPPRGKGGGHHFRQETEG